ncbi:hypothetical protein CIB48_g2077 [Xylaria polymorpha]|nr:hypothetical protein CIB48_g2077 [Xylaria polymorpha]
MSNAYMRTGRGGAGNFYSQKDVEDAATKDSTEDIEAQKTPTLDDNSTAPSSSSTPSTSAAGAYARSGRGGAGNFVSATPSSTLPSSASTYSGRGGAGNWAAESEGATRAKEEQDRRRKEALDAGIAQEIRASLPRQPRRTYHLHGRRPENGDDAVRSQEGERRF